MFCHGLLSAVGRCHTLLSECGELFVRHRLLFWSTSLVLVLLSLGGSRTDSELVIVQKQGPEQRPYCSFFNNRAPTAQPGLRNCTWYKDNSCCQQQEIEATFGRVKPLKGASPACQKYLNFLMCYICSPDQHLFYQNERLTVCEEFCDGWYGACSSSILKGSVIGELYDNGKEFCKSRRFLVDSSSARCFTVDFSLLLSGSARHGETSHWRTFCVLAVLLVVRFT